MINYTLMQIWKNDRNIHSLILRYIRRQSLLRYNTENITHSKYILDMDQFVLTVYIEYKSLINIFIHHNYTSLCHDTTDL